MTNDDRSDSFETTESELDAGFDAVMARLRNATDQERAELRLASDRAEIGHAAYAQGMHHLQDGDGDLDEAVRWLRHAHEMGVSEAGRVLRSVLSRQETHEEPEQLPQSQEQVLAAPRAGACVQQEGADAPKTAPRPATVVVEPEPPVSLTALDRLHQVTADMNTARGLADTLQTVADGVVNGLGYELACVNLVRPDGDLVVAALAGNSAAEALITGRVGSRTSWDRRLSMGEAWGDLRFIPHTEGWVLDEDDVPQWYTDGPAPRFEDEWHPSDRLFAPMYATGASGGELIGVISVDRPRNGLRPDAWGRKALQMYAFQAAVAISNARLRANMQRALVRLEREQQALRASEESFRQAFEYAPSGMAVAEMGGDQHGRILRTNDALCRLLGRPASAMRRYSFSDLVHPEDLGTLLRTSAEGGRAELRLGRRDGTYVWVSLRNSVVADAADGPGFLLTHVEDIEERKRRELQLAHRASHDALTGLPNSAELRSRLTARLCSRPQVGRPGSEGAVPPLPTVHAEAAYAEPVFDHHVHVVAPARDESGVDGGTAGLAVLFCDLDGFTSINDRFGHNTGDAVLIEVARRLTSGVRDSDTVARLGGDKFVILADGLGPADAQDLAARLRGAIIPPIRTDGRAVRVGASFGIAWAHCGMTAEEVLQSPGHRMYVDKRSARQRQNRPTGATG